MSAAPDPGTPGTHSASAAVQAARDAMSRLVVDVPDWPEAGVTFKDITPLLADPVGLAAVVEALAEAGRDDDGEVCVDVVVGLEARGFIFAAPVALALGVGFVPARKEGKLPRERHAVSYSLEYGGATLELHRDAVAPGQRVLVVDDVLATGGTVRAAVELVGSCGGEVAGVAVLMELGFLDGRAALEGLALHPLVVV